MRSKLLSGVAALALTVCTVVATAGPASAQWRGGWGGWRGGWGGWGWGGGLAAGVIGGAALAAATSPLWASGYYDYYPGYGGYGYGTGYGYGAGYAPGYYGAGYGYGDDYGGGYYGAGYGTGYGYGTGVYDYAPTPYVATTSVVAPGGGNVAYCQARFRTYNASTGMYMGYDGQYHSCP